MFETLILKWGYLVLGIGTFLEGENILITAGVMAHKGLLSLPLVILVATIGAFLGDICWYFVGRRFGNPYIQKRPKLIQRVEGVRRLLDKYGTLFVLSFRFIYGLRSVSPLILGALHYPVPKFIALNAVAAVVWGVSFSYLGFTLGAGFLELAGRHPLLEEAVLIAAGSVFILWLLFRIAKRRNH